MPLTLWRKVKRRSNAGESSPAPAPPVPPVHHLETTLFHKCERNPFPVVFVFSCAPPAFKKPRHTRRRCCVHFLVEGHRPWPQHAFSLLPCSSRRARPPRPPPRRSLSRGHPGRQAPSFTSSFAPLRATPCERWYETQPRRAPPSGATSATLPRASTPVTSRTLPPSQRRSR